MEVSIYELLAAARESAKSDYIKGDSILCEKRFHPDTHYMVEMELLGNDNKLGEKGNYIRKFMRLDNAVPNAATCRSLELGVIRCIDETAEQVRRNTAESVTEGHPDKVCDQIADAILDECLRYDPSSRVACEVLATRGNVFVAGEITSGYEPPVFDVIRKVLEECGYCTDGIEMDTFVHQQSPDIAKAVSVSKEFRDNIGAKIRDRSRGAGDQGVMVGYCREDSFIKIQPSEIH